MSDLDDLVKYPGPDSVPAKLLAIVSWSVDLDDGRQSATTADEWKDAVRRVAFGGQSTIPALVEWVNSEQDEMIARIDVLDPGEYPEILRSLIGQVAELSRELDAVTGQAAALLWATTENRDLRVVGDRA